MPNFYIIISDIVFTRNNLIFINSLRWFTACSTVWLFVTLAVSFPAPPDKFEEETVEQRNRPENFTVQWHHSAVIWRTVTSGHPPNGGITQQWDRFSDHIIYFFTFKDNYGVTLFVLTLKAGYNVSRCFWL